MASTQKFVSFAALAALASLSANSANAAKSSKQEVYSATETTAPAQTTAAPAYDPVPSDQIEALAKRLQLTETLIRKHARAYDYRALTIKDLQAILAKLDASVAPQAAAAPAANTAAAVTAKAGSTEPAAPPVPDEADED